MEARMIHAGHARNDAFGEKAHGVGGSRSGARERLVDERGQLVPLGAARDALFAECSQVLDDSIDGFVAEPAHFFGRWIERRPGHSGIVHRAKRRRHTRSSS